MFTDNAVNTVIYQNGCAVNDFLTVNETFSVLSVVSAVNVVMTVPLTAKAVNDCLKFSVNVIHKIEIDYIGNVKKRKMPFRSYLQN